MDISLYDTNSTLIVITLFVSMLGALEIGKRAGASHRLAQTEAAREQIGAIQASFFGVLALLLGFTFSLSLERFDSRSQALVDEINAIGTTFLRTDLLSQTDRTEARRILRDYIDLRVRSSQVSLDNRAEHTALVLEAERAEGAIWNVAVRAANARRDAVTFGFAQAVNDMIDALGRRDAALERHVPDVVLLLLFGTFLMAGLIIGYGSGTAGHRPSIVTYGLVLLITVLVFIIIDLDRPRRGLITIDTEGLMNLRASVYGATD